MLFALRPHGRQLLVLTALAASSLWQSAPLAAGECGPACSPRSITGLFWQWPSGAYGRNYSCDVPRGTECSNPPIGPYYGYFPTCWQHWPQGWQNCPVTESSVPVGQQPRPAGQPPQEVPRGAPVPADSTPLEPIPGAPDPSPSVGSIQRGPAPQARPAQQQRQRQQVARPQSPSRPAELRQTEARQAEPQPAASAAMRAEPTPAGQPAVEEPLADDLAEFLVEVEASPKAMSAIRRSAQPTPTAPAPRQSVLAARKSTTAALPLRQPARGESPPPLTPSTLAAPAQLGAKSVERAAPLPRTAPLDTQRQSKAIAQPQAAVAAVETQIDTASLEEFEDTLLAQPRELAQPSDPEANPLRGSAGKLATRGANRLRAAVSADASRELGIEAGQRLQLRQPQSERPDYQLSEKTSDRQADAQTGVRRPVPAQIVPRPKVSVAIGDQNPLRAVRR